MKISAIRPMIDVMAFAEGESQDPPARIKLIPVGEYNTRAYGKITITKADVVEMAQHFNEGIRAGGKDAGLPIDVEHGTTVYKDAAAGWIKEITAEEDGGWGDIEWTKLGKRLLTDKEYKFYSPEYHPVYRDPEQTNVQLKNVMTGGGLVNKPMFKKDLPPLMMSEVGAESDKNSHLTDKNKSSTLFLELTENLQNPSSENKMDVKTILAKEAAKRTAEEVAFLAEHKEELTFAEAKKEGFAEDKEVKKTTEPTVVKAGEGEVVVKASELAELKTMAAEGVAANTALRRTEVKEKVKKIAATEKGVRLASDQVDKWTDRLMKMSEAERTETLTMLEELPVKEVLEEKGGETGIKSSEAGKELDKKVQEYIKEHKGTSYSSALGIIAQENPQLFSEYNTNLPRAGVER